MLQFRRITTQNRLIAQIDGRRFVAIARVVFFTLTPFFRIGAPFPLPCLLTLVCRSAESHSFLPSADSNWGFRLLPLFFETAPQ